MNSVGLRKLIEPVIYLGTESDASEKAIDAFCAGPPEFQHISDLLRRANGHLTAGEIGAAKSVLDKGMQRWPDAGSLLLLQARIAEADGRPNVANQLFRQAAAALHVEAANFSKDPYRALALAQALMKCGETAAASSFGFGASARP